MLFVVKSCIFFVAYDFLFINLAIKRNCVMSLFVVFGRLPIAGRKDWAIKSFSRTAVAGSPTLLADVPP
jgi:hypothetical protein